MSVPKWRVFAAEVSALILRDHLCALVNLVLLVSMGVVQVHKIMKYCTFFSVALLLDIDECVEDPCPKNVNCLNREGSYECTDCFHGYEMTSNATDGSCSGN